MRDQTLSGPERETPGVTRFEFALWKKARREKVLLYTTRIVRMPPPLGKRANFVCPDYYDTVTCTVCRLWTLRGNRGPPRRYRLQKSAMRAKSARLGGGQR